jgi:hypothetical protein
LHKQLGKDYITELNYIQYCIVSPIFWKSQTVKSKDGIDFAMLFTLRRLQRWGKFCGVVALYWFIASLFAQLIPEIKMK